MQQCRHEFILIIRKDTVLEPGMVDKLVDARREGIDVRVLEALDVDNVIAQGGAVSPIAASAAFDEVDEFSSLLAPRP